MENEPVAWVKINGLQGKQAWLSMLVVSEEFQRRGVGSFAVRFAERFARQKGFASLGIHTNSDNAAARRCYEKLGYTLTEESECTNGDGQTRMGCTYMSNRIIADITDFIFVADEPRKADAIFIPSGSDPAPSELAAKLYADGFAPLIIPSGGVSVKTGKFNTVRVQHFQGKRNGFDSGDGLI
jgi:hypothetical protein